MIGIIIMKGAVLISVMKGILMNSVGRFSLLFFLSVFYNCFLFMSDSKGMMKTVIYYKKSALPFIVLFLIACDLFSFIFYLLKGEYSRANLSIVTIFVWLFIYCYI